MAVSSAEVLRAGLGLKLEHVRRATRSYFRDRTNEATGKAVSYAIGAGLFAGAGIFMLAALIVGVAALFRWAELNYGEFPAFGAAGGALVLLALVCSASATIALKRKSPRVLPLASRLRVAVASPHLPEGVVGRAAKETASAAGSRITRKMNPATTGMVLGVLALSGFAIARRLTRHPADLRLSTPAEKRGPHSRY